MHQPLRLTSVTFAKTTTSSFLTVHFFINQSLFSSYQVHRPILNIFSLLSAIVPIDVDPYNTSDHDVIDLGIRYCCQEHPDDFPASIHELLIPLPR
jgi:hypothetical protein